MYVSENNVLWNFKVCSSLKKIKNKSWDIFSQFFAQKFQKAIQKAIQKFKAKILNTKLLVSKGLSKVLKCESGSRKLFTTAIKLCNIAATHDAACHMYHMDAKRWGRFL